MIRINDLKLDDVVEESATNNRYHISNLSKDWIGIDVNGNVYNYKPSQFRKKFVCLRPKNEDGTGIIIAHIIKKDKR